MGNSVGKYEAPYIGSGWWAGFLSFYDYFERIGITVPEFTQFREWAKTGVWESLWFEDLCVIVCRPSKINKDAQGRLHGETMAAAEWPSGEKYWFWHGTQVTEQIIVKPETLTKKQIVEEKNSEVSRAIAERLGWDAYLKHIDTILVDKWFDERTSSHYELYDFKNRKGSMQPRLLKMESPELNDGTRPHYIEPVPPEIKTCRAARRWQCDPQGDQYKDNQAKWTAICNDDSTLEFEVEA